MVTKRSTRAKRRAIARNAYHLNDHQRADRALRFAAIDMLDWALYLGRNALWGEITSQDDVTNKRRCIREAKRYLDDARHFRQLSRQ